MYKILNMLKLYVAVPLEENRRKFYLHVETKSAIYLFEIDRTSDLTHWSLSLAEQKSKAVQLELITIDFNELTLKVNIKLDEHLDKSDAIELDPSANRFHSANFNSQHLFLLLDHFQILKCSENGRLIDENDEYDELISNVEADKRKESLFDLVYERRGELKMASISNEDVQRLSGLR